MTDQPPKKADTVDHRPDNSMRCGSVYLRHAESAGV